MTPIYFIGLLLIAGAGFFLFRKKKEYKKAQGVFPKAWRSILHKNISFYNALSQEEKQDFETQIFEFILNYKITGIDTEIDITDKILVAAGAVIPVFYFPEWRYYNLKEVLIYPSSFNQQFQTGGSNANILGMVGTGYMEGKMILSKKALHQGFKNAGDKKNTAVHEFIHLIDKADGNIDGIPNALLSYQYAIPWLDLLHKKINDIHENNSDINPYGATNSSEFFAVAGEYLFEKPALLKRKHPKLYNQLKEVFNHDFASLNLSKKPQSIGRNSPCPCGSDKKYKKCCGRGN